jgi:hypothetical protein
MVRNSYEKEQTMALVNGIGGYRRARIAVSTFAETISWCTSREQQRFNSTI